MFSYSNRLRVVLFLQLLPPFRWVNLVGGRQYLLDRAPTLICAEMISAIDESIPPNYQEGTVINLEEDLEDKVLNREDQEDEVGEEEAEQVVELFRPANHVVQEEQLPGYNQLPDVFVGSTAPSNCKPVHVEEAPTIVVNSHDDEDSSSPWPLISKSDPYLD